MKKIIFIVCAAFVALTSTNSYAQYYSFGLGPVGNIYAIDGGPQMDPGVGGYLFFDYRWNPQLSTQISIIVTTEDGKGPDKGDRGIEFLGIPTFDIKWYILSNVTRFDPYLLVGIGIYAISEGGRDNGTFAIGFGANAGIGCDFYLNDRWSLGLVTSFRGIGLIDDTSGPNNGKAIFPVSLMGNVAYHF